jgi:hypothetical protein
MEAEGDDKSERIMVRIKSNIGSGGSGLSLRLDDLNSVGDRELFSATGCDQYL